MGKSWKAIILRDDDEHERVSDRIRITSDILRDEGVEIEMFSGNGNRFPERFFSLSYAGDLVSVYLALLKGLDPTSIERISRLKKELS